MERFSNERSIPGVRLLAGFPYSGDAECANDPLADLSCAELPDGFVDVVREAGAIAVGAGLRPIR